jgi:protein O-GlcNAc transferase
MFKWLKRRSDSQSEVRAYVRVGFEAREKGDRASARAAFEGALGLDPGNADAHYFLGIDDLGAGAFDAALDHLDRAIAADSLQPAFHVARGEALWRLGAHGPAVEAVENALIRDPDLVDGWHLATRILVDAGRPADAVAMLERAAETLPEEATIAWACGAHLHAAGRETDATRHLLRAWSSVAGDAEAGLALARFALETPDLPAGVESLCRAVLALVPDHEGAGSVLGLALAGTGDVGGGIAQLERIAAAHAGSALVGTHLGIAHRISGDLEAACVVLSRVHTAFPDLLPAMVEYAAALAGRGQLSEAAALLHRAVAIAPGDSNAHFLLGVTLRGLHDFESAEVMFEKAHRLGGHPQALSELATLLLQRGRFAAAAQWFLELLSLKPDSASVHNDLGIALGELSRYDEAIRLFRRAAELAPTLAQPLVCLSSAYFKQHMVTRAEEEARRAVAVAPRNPDALMALANALQAFGRYSESVPTLRTVIEVAPEASHAWSNLLLAFNYLDESTPQSLLDEHRRFGARPECRERRRPAEFVRKAGARRLRIGYMSPDFRNHVVGRFAEPVLRAHDRNAVEVICYSVSRKSDASTARFREIADLWRDLAGQDDDDAERIVLADELDVLVDLSGHTADNRLQLLARRLAPVQVTWLGYPNGTGLAAMDWRLTDAIADPAPDADAHSTERLFRLPDVFIVYDPPKDAPEVAPTPCLAAGHVEFGVFNNYQKVTDRALACWREILERVPGAIMKIKTPVMGDDGLQAALRSRLEALGFDLGRVRLMGPVPSLVGHLQSMAATDIALDTFPYNGTTTTCESLWMGLPLITLAGDRHSSRVSASLLNAIGHGDLVAHDDADYIERAVALALDPERLARLRGRIRPDMAASPLVDIPRFARALERAYGQMREIGSGGR